MPNRTTNYKLIKPLPEEFYNIEEFNSNMDIIDEALGDGADHAKNTENPHNVTAEQIGAQPQNDNLTEYKGGVLQTIDGKEVKISSIEISPNEPAEGDVWIDTDDSDDGEGASKAVTFTVTLTASGWSGKTQTIRDSRFVAFGYAYTVTPASGNFGAYVESQIYAADVTTNEQMTFTCGEKVPSESLTVNILRIEVEA